MFDLVEKLKTYVPFDDTERQNVEEVLKFLKISDNCYDRSNLKGHITAGAFVCDKSGNILLNHHQKTDMWFQFGGHSDGESDSLNVARREVQEESGITDVETSGEIFDVSAQKIDASEKKHEPQHYHYDINFLFFAKTHDFKVSNESKEIKWVTVEEAKKLVDKNDLPMQRMLCKYEKYLKENCDLIRQNIILNDSEDKSFENDTMIAVKSNNLKNHTLVGSYVIIPKSQVESPFLLSEKEWNDTKLLLNEIKAYLDEKYRPDGYNIGWNVGKVAGQEVAHAHLHVIPRYSDEPLAGKGIRYWFKQPENIRSSLKDKNN